MISSLKYIKGESLNNKFWNMHFSSEEMIYLIIEGRKLNQFMRFDSLLHKPRRFDIEWV